MSAGRAIIRAIIIIHSIRPGVPLFGQICARMQFGPLSALKVVGEVTKVLMRQN